MLGIEPGAKAAEVKAAHRRLAREWHPDTNATPEAHARMSAINRAREVLLDPVARSEFDRNRPVEAPMAARPAPAPARPGREIHLRARQPKANPTVTPAPPRQDKVQTPGPRGRYTAAPDFERDWYAFLGVSARAPGKEIRAALGRKAMAMQGTSISATEVARRNAELRAAQATIGDPSVRAAYDRARGTGRGKG